MVRHDDESEAVLVMLWGGGFRQVSQQRHRVRVTTIPTVTMTTMSSRSTAIHVGRRNDDSFLPRLKVSPFPLFCTALSFPLFSPLSSSLLSSLFFHLLSSLISSPLSSLICSALSSRLLSPLSTFLSSLIHSPLLPPLLHHLPPSPCFIFSLFLPSFTPCLSFLSFFLLFSGCCLRAASSRSKGLWFWGVCSG